MIAYQYINEMIKFYEDVSPAAQVIGFDLKSFKESKDYSNCSIWKYRNGDLAENNISDGELTDIFNKSENFRYDNAASEVINNLYLLLNNENRIVYIKSVLRAFKDFALFFNLTGDALEDISNAGLCTEDIEHVERCIAYLKRALSGTDDINIERSFAELYLHRCYSNLLFFTAAIFGPLHEFGISLHELQDQTGIFITDLDRDLLLEISGFTNKEIYGKILRIEQQVKNDVLSVNVILDNPTIFQESLIRDLRKLFDGILWQEEDISDEAFLNYWRPGYKRKFLPVKNKSGLIYLLEIRLIKHLRDPELNQKSRAAMFNFTDTQYSDLKSKYNLKAKGIDAPLPNNIKIVNAQLSTMNYIQPTKSGGLGLHIQP